jgi:hypothetical protein
MLKEDSNRRLAENSERRRLPLSQSDRVELVHIVLDMAK